MNQVLKQYRDDYHALLKEAEAQPLVFRRKARQAVGGLTRLDRRQLRRLNSDMASPLDFYRAWEAALPQFATVENGRTAKVLVDGFTKHLMYTPEESSQLLDRLANERTNQLKADFLTELYGRGEWRARRMAARLLDLDHQEIRRQWTAYVTRSLYDEVSLEKSFTVYDREAPLAQRLFQRGRERAQIRRFKRKTQGTLDKSRRLIGELEVQDGGILASLFALNINLVSIRAAHRRYEKASQALSVADQKKAAKRLALYEKEVAELRTQYLDALPGTRTLRDIRQASSELDTVFVRIFDMDTHTYNELMVRMKTYRDQVREQERLLRQLSDEG